jgi:putative transposase
MISLSANSTPRTRNMFRISRFQEVLKHLPRGVFDRAVSAQQADKYRKSFSCWQQLVSMVYAQLSGATSLRTLQSSFNAHSAHHYHLGCQPLRRTTLADANAQGNEIVFSAVAQALMQQVRGRARADAQEFLELIDSTSITLKGRGFDPWTRQNRTRHTQGLKLHVVFGLGEGAPLAQSISAPNLNDLDYARTLAPRAGSIYVFDKAYCDYTWWWAMTQSGAQFVTRFKRNSRLQVKAQRAVPREARGIILKDEQVYLSNKNPGGGRTNPYSEALRRIEVAREGKPSLVLATNDLKSSALRIAERYKARWQIELFFKWIKQHLSIKRFLGRTQAAVRIQILTALIAYLLAALHAQANGIKTSLWLFLSELRATLFQRPDIELDRHRRWRKQRLMHDLYQQPLFT